MRDKAPPPVEPHTTIGAIMIAMGAITQEQLDHALAEQEVNPDAALGGMLIGMGHVSPSQVRFALDLQTSLRSNNRSEKASAEQLILKMKTKAYVAHANRVVGGAEMTKEKLETGNHPALKTVPLGPEKKP